MKLEIRWLPVLPLIQTSQDNLIYNFDYDKLPTQPGIYIFGRMYGKNFEALYVGKAVGLRNRTKGQLNNLRLMQHLKNSRSGKKVLLVGKFIPKPGQQEDKCLKILERTLIRHFLSDGHDLVNIQGTHLRQHEIISAQSKLVPKTMFMDRR